MSEDDEMYVTKRNGERENVAFDKILRRIKTIGTEVDIKINQFLKKRLLKNGMPMKLQIF